MPKIDLGGLVLDCKSLAKYMRQDLKDDWFPDPLQFDDLLDAETLEQGLSSNFARNHGVYTPGQRTLYEEIDRALAAGRPVVTGTKQFVDGQRAPTNGLFPSHHYAVLDRRTRSVGGRTLHELLLRNPYRDASIYTQGGATIRSVPSGAFRP